MSTLSSGDASGQTVGRDTSNRVGATTTSPSSQLEQKRTSLRTRQKRSTELESSGTSKTSASRSSLSCGNKHTSNDVALERPKNSKKKKAFVPTENHMKLRRVEDAGEKWESELESIHGFADGECCIIMGIIATHINKKTTVFPEANGDRYVQHAKTGWEIQKEHNRLMKLYPKCVEDQKKVNGEWVQRSLCSTRGCHFDGRGIKEGGIHNLLERGRRRGQNCVGASDRKDG